MSIKVKKFGLSAEALAKAGLPRRKTFRERVFGVVAKIPRGQTLTYKQVAARAGNPAACRAVGNIMASNKDPRKVPCHRVVRSDGKIGGYGMGGARKKEELLRREGAIR